MIEQDYKLLSTHLGKAKCKSVGEICKVTAQFLSSLYKSNIVSIVQHSSSFIEFVITDNKDTVLDDFSTLMLKVSDYCVSKLGHKAFITNFDVLSTENKSKMFIGGYVDNSIALEQVKVEFKFLVTHKGNSSKAFRDNAISGMTAENKKYYADLMQLHTKSDWTRLVALIRSLSKDSVKGICKKGSIWYIKLNRDADSSATKRIGAFVASYCHSCRVYDGESIFMISKNAPAGLIIFILKFSKDWRVRTVCTIKLV